MKKRKFKGSEKKLEKIENYKKHFGWQTESKEGRILVMTIDNKSKNYSKLMRLEKQASVMNKSLPTRMIGWAISAAIFFSLFFFIKDGVLFNAVDLNDLFSFIPIKWLSGLLVNLIPILCLVFGSLDAFFALYELCVFFILKFVKRKTLKEIYRVADALSGNIIDAPLEHNIAPNSANTGVLSKVDIGSNYRDE